MLLLTREEEKVAEARAEGLAEAAAKRAEEMRSLLNRLMINGFSRERAIDLLGENIQ